MKSVAKWVLAGAVCALAVGPADAQGQGQGRGQGRGGFGGFTIGPLQLVGNKDVLDDVKASDEQKKKLEDWVKETQPKFFEKMREKTADLPFDQEGFAKRAEITAEMNKELWKDVEGVLKPEQVTRVRQISVQGIGIRAFSDKAVVEKLKLADDQKDKIKAIVDETNMETGTIRREAFSGGFDQEKMTEANKKVAEVEKKAKGKIAETLKDDQKKAWEELTGKEFDTTKLFVIPMRRGGF